MRVVVALLLGALGVVSAGAYTRATVSGSLGDLPLFRPDAASIPFAATSNTAAGLLNADNRLLITADSDPLAALQAALEAWSGTAVSTVNFQPLTTADLVPDPNDGRHLFSFLDTPGIRALTMDAVAVSRVRFSAATGEIHDSDILFNPNFRSGNNVLAFSTTLALNTFDLQSAATHELGIALGGGRSGTIGSAMFPMQPRAVDFQRTLSHDDRALLYEAYPAAGAAGSFGSLAGAATVGGAPATGVLLTAVDPDLGVAVSTISDLTDGTFLMNGLPPGRYFLYGEPLDGPVIPADIQRVNLSRFNTRVLVRFQGGNVLPQRVRVTAGATSRSDLSLNEGVRPLSIEQIGIAPAGSAGVSAPLTTGPARLRAGQSADLLLVGPGVDASLREEDIQLLIPGLTIRPGSAMVDPRLTAGVGRAPILRLTVDVARRVRRDYGSIIVRKGNVVGAYSGALIIEPARPVFVANGVVNGASFRARAAAPGSIVSIFGDDLGPAEGVAVEGFDPATGGLPTALAAVRVTFDGVPAPLFFVSGGQINLQVPFEIAGRATVLIVVEYDGAVSKAAAAPVAAADPGIFTSGIDGRAVVLNQNNALNSPADPARRGEFITIFATGQGLVVPALASGQPAPAGDLRRARNVSVTIGGVEVPPGAIFFAGMTPGFVGLLQINVQVPAEVTPGDVVELVISIGGVPSQPGVTIAVE